MKAGYCGWANRDRKKERPNMAKKEKAVKTEKKEKLVPDVVRPTRLQSAKIWHEGETFKLIFAKGTDGQKAERVMEKFPSLPALMTRLSKLAQS